MPVWFVCPPLEDPGEPILVPSQAAGERLLDCVISVEEEARIRDCSVEEVQTLRAKREPLPDFHKIEMESYLQHLAGRQREASKAGDLDAVENIAREIQELQHKLSGLLPSYTKTYRQQDWRCVEGFRYDVPGPSCTRTLRQFLSAKQRPAIIQTGLAEEFERTQEGRSGECRCEIYGSDWRLEEIRIAAAKRCVWLPYTVEANASVGEPVITIALVVEDAFKELHPQAPCGAIEHFWSSRLVRVVLTDLCDCFIDSQIFLALFKINRIAALEAEVKKAKWFLFEQLVEFAQQLSAEEEGLPTVPATAIKTEATLSAERSEEKESRQALFRQYLGQRPENTRESHLDDVASAVGKTRRAVEAWLYCEGRSGKPTDRAIRKYFNDCDAKKNSVKTA